MPCHSLSSRQFERPEYCTYNVYDICLITILVCFTLMLLLKNVSIVKIFNYSCDSFTYLSACAPLTGQPFLLSSSILLSFYLF
jgi:hypothetical protein